MTLLKMYQHHTHEYIFKFIYDIGYWYATDSCVLESHSCILKGYIKVLKGYKYEDS